ncbi:MAG: hypothetical protein Ct9H300mP15_29500 [Gemmatimonadota bacterium]|nr:MAG: hypothetical protein Ct9H300mP15_29500 [Gemmatimonadota bacterium]
MRPGNWRKDGFPIMIKATAGGGGKGMRIVEDAEHFPKLLQALKGSKTSFGDDGVYWSVASSTHAMSRFKFWDSEGRVVHLGERECSIQRRHQKLIEEAPSPGLSPELRQEMGDAAILAARSID